MNASAAQSFGLARFERFANHLGDVIPHTSNYGTGDRRDLILPFSDRRCAKVDAELRERFSPLRVMEHESPAVLTVTNVEGAFGTTGERPEPEAKAAPRQKGGMYGGSEFKTRTNTPNWKPNDAEGADGRPKRTAAEQPERSGQPAFENVGWHTDLDFEEVPATISMFLVQCAPAEGGETHFCDTAAAWEALEPEEQRYLEGVRVLRRMEEGDPVIQRHFNPPSFSPGEVALGPGVLDAAGAEGRRDGAARAPLPALPAAVHPAGAGGRGDGEGGGQGAAGQALVPPHAAALPVPPRASAGRRRGVRSSSVPDLLTSLSLQGRLVRIVLPLTGMVP